MSEFLNRKQRKARKRHLCDVCGGAIPKNTEYIELTQLYCGAFYSTKLHIHCEALGDAFCQSGENGDYEDFDPDACREWIRDEACGDCESYDACKVTEFQCAKVIGRLVPVNHQSAALSSLWATIGGK